MIYTREIPTQRISGREMTEREMFLQAIHHIDSLHTLMRGIAISRKEPAFLAVAGNVERMKHLVGQLINARPTTPMFIPPRVYR